MNRVAGLCVGVTLATLVQAQQDFSKVEITAEKLADTVYMLTGAGGNIGLSVGDDGVFMIDSQFAPLAPRIQEAIGKLTPKPVTFLINTHWHFDHQGGNEHFARGGAVVVAHESVLRRMSAEGFIEFLGMRVKAEPRQALPVVTFTRELTFHYNRDFIYVSHAPRAHTDGDSIVHFKKSDVIHMGDTFFNRIYPFIDTSSGGTVEGVIANADRVYRLALDKTRIIPGHGPLATRADLKAFRDMLADVSDRIYKEMQSGKSTEQIVATRPTAKYDAVWGKGFLSGERFTDMLVKNLQKVPPPPPAKRK